MHKSEHFIQQFFPEKAFDFPQLFFALLDIIHTIVADQSKCGHIQCVGTYAIKVQ